MKQDVILERPSKNSASFNDKTQETYNWIKQLLDETNGKGEEDDLL